MVLVTLVLYIYICTMDLYVLFERYLLSSHPGNSKKTKKNKTGCFSFNFFLNFAKENWWEEYFFLNFLIFLNFRDGPNSKNSKNSKKNWPGFFLNFLNFLNFDNPQKENWWEESFFF